MPPNMKVRVVKDIEIPRLGAKIKAARKADARAVRELAKLAGISRGYWYDLEAERVRSSVPFATIQAVADVLGMDLEMDGEVLG
jgi:transcriptional regulator with XRE-family HTH domain